MEESQREAMFNAWKIKEDKKQNNCKHRWGYAEPILCLDCGLVKSKYDGRTNRINDTN
jgi:hypothetical protein